MAMLVCDANVREDANISAWNSPRRDNAKIEFKRITLRLLEVVSNRRSATLHQCVNQNNPASSTLNPTVSTVSILADLSVSKQQ
jgi:hypothetical protein